MKSVDATRFKIKSKAVKRALARSVAVIVQKSAQEVYLQAAKNLAGPHYGTTKSGPQTGKMPIPRRTANLAGSLRHTPISSVLHAVWADPRKANYAKFVHDGTWKMRPRRFIGDVITERRPIIQEKIRQKIIKAIRIEGRK